MSGVVFRSSRSSRSRARIGQPKNRNFTLTTQVCAGASAEKGVESEMVVGNLLVSAANVKIELTSGKSRSGRLSGSYLLTKSMMIQSFNCRTVLRGTGSLFVQGFGQRSWRVGVGVSAGYWVVGEFRDVFSE